MYVIEVPCGGAFPVDCSAEFSAEESSDSTDIVSETLISKIEKLLS